MAASALASQSCAKVTCPLDSTPRHEDTLECYRQQVESQPLQYELKETSRLPDGVETRTYRLTSQSWSPDNLVSPPNWTHDTTLYLPTEALPHRALIVVNNGTRYPQDGISVIAPTDFSRETLASIAKNTRSVVVSVSDVPNQYLSYADDGKPRAEDDSVAHSWSLYMRAPEQRATLPLHVPMAAAIWRSMSLAQRELTDLRIERFIVSGLSKRAWSSWLAVIGDQRIDAIVPFAIDLLSTRDALKNMFRSYGGNWPIAFYPYYAEGVDLAIDTPEFGSLMQIEDPLAYLGTRHGNRLSIPKYIVNASGDDFFVPDNSSLYFDRLPGNKSLRMVPNSSHAGIRDAVRESLTQFVNRIQKDVPIPEIDAKLYEIGEQAMIELKASEQPTGILLWQANNPNARDFRYVCGIRYTSSSLKHTLRDPVRITVDKPTAGWRAYFVEATFQDGFTATTQTFILGDGYPSNAPPDNGDACKTLPGREMKY
ncbi:PhoPQ-activated protein PqaA family protein [Burkholderia metallica]|uniref:PhoPQ-activated protein PqaA family protein n=1 Tax=Burkholderia metallica TaxID=488729 RepID=A0ABT8P8Q5_9BURK|nr:MULTISPECIES: PhoPQ-activated protein PqaA family protein [Burkholderia cepacia complex]MDN7931453.1 PhoPQ-activated protein PqaA family protein [Burkholderia metallica]